MKHLPPFFKLGLILLPLVIGSIYTQAQSDSTGKSFTDIFQLRGYVKNMQGFQMADLNYVSHSNLIHNRLNFRAYVSPTVTFGVELETEFLREIKSILIQYSHNR